VPIRIYALAKELKYDSKELVDICTKAGITGKGSALASLEDAEVDKVKAFLAGGEKKATGTPKAAAPDKPVEPTSYTRDDYIAPVAPGKIKVIDKPAGDAKKKDKDTGADEAKPKKKREPVIRLANMPESQQPPPKPVSNEPAAQKPEIRLPKDAIAGHKKGSRAPLEHLTKSAEKPSPLSGKGGLSRKDVVPAGEPPLGTSGTRNRRGGGKATKDDEGSRGLAGMASARADRQKARKSRAKQRTGDDDGPRRPIRRTLTRKGTNTAAPRKGKVQLELPCTVRSFSEAAGVPSAQVQRVLMGLNVMATINAKIEEEYVEMIAAELGVELEFKAKETLEDSIISRIREQEEEPGSLQLRPPVVTFLGHVDHGKTSLLDRILAIDVVSGEAGGITQHIRAYKIDNHGRPIGFVDTPGHEAFTEMRARGANVTDIAVLVVAADDGVMPQTEEAISHAKAAEVPIVVAMNKMDLPGANPENVLQQLAAKELLASEWGGDVEVVRTSAINGEGIDELLETLLTIAELNEYQANPERDALGICLESEQEPGRGVVAKLIVQKGTLRVGDVVVCGPAHGRVKAMYDTLRPSVTVDEATPSTPVNVTGFDIAPNAGDAFYVLEDITQARQIATQRASDSHEQDLSERGTVEIPFERFRLLLEEGRLGREDSVVTLNMIIRADVQGSLEAITKELGKLDHPEVQVKVLQQSVGGVTVGDVQLANASNAVIAGFNVIPDEAARLLADERQVEIRRYDIIYKLTEDIKALLEGKLKPEERVVELGRAVVKQVFPISRVGTVAGCYVVQGAIERGCRIRVNRDGRTIGDYPLESLRREKDDTKEVPRGMECGMKLSGFNDIKQDDVLESYKIEEVARTL
jgi:translation initiation factor IF-2